MRILLSNFQSVFGGGEIVTLDIANYLRDKGHEVCFITKKNSLFSKECKRLKYEGFEVGTFGGYFNIVLHYKIKKFFRNNSFEVLLCNSTKDVKLLAKHAFIAGVKRIVLRRGIPVALKTDCFTKRTFRKYVSGLITPSEYVKDVINSKGEVFPREKIEVIQNGVDMSLYLNIAPADNVVPVIGMVGRLSAEKRYDLAIRVAGLIKEEGVAFKLLIAGEGSKRKELEKMVCSLSLSKEVELVGFVDKSWEFLERCDMFVHTSLTEGQSSAIIQAIVAGRPVFAFDIGSVQELKHEGFYGYLTKAGDVEDMAQHVVEFIKDRNKDVERRELSRERVRRNNDREVQLGKIAEYLLRGI